MTDSELFMRWQDNREAMRAAQKARDDRQVADLLREGEFLKHEWETLVERKRRGEITDTTFIDLAMKAAKGMNLMHGLPLRFDAGGGENDDDSLPLSWWVTATVEGPSVVSNERLESYARAATAEMLAEDDEYLLLVKRPGPELVPENFYRLMVDLDGTTSIQWSIDPWSWPGPDPRWRPPNRRRRRWDVWDEWDG